ncbi:MAG: NADP(H)-dependent aldo-keto reductase [Geminicoccales bacterium]
MEHSRLGRSDLEVSRICLGSMTWGEQNTEADALRQLDAARDAGVNFIDASEMYPIPPRPQTHGLAEVFLGNWLRSRGGRDEIVIAGKVVGRSDNKTPFLRGGRARLDRANIEAALDATLRRLGTDYVDLYQLHWPDRRTNNFGQRGYESAGDGGVPLAETLQVLGDLVRAGKVRQVGVSNETPWGLMTCLRLAAELGLPRVVSIQNPYSLLNRTFEIGLSEIAIREDCGLMAYSPLAFGVLTGKYLGGRSPPGARLTLFPQYTRYSGPRAEEAVEAYVRIARRHGLDPAQMAIAFVIGRPFVISTVIGATNDAQLATALAAAALELPAEVLDEIESVHRALPDPCP